MEKYVDEISVLTESGEESEYDYSRPSVQSNVQKGSRTNPQGRVLGDWQKFSRQRKRQASFIRNTGENDHYDMTIAPLNIYENQVSTTIGYQKV